MEPACTGLVVKWTGDPWNGMGPVCTGLVAIWIGDPWNARDAATGWTGLGTCVEWESECMRRRAVPVPVDVE